MEFTNITEIKLNIWGEYFTLPVKYENSNHNHITEIQKKAIDEFISNKSMINSTKSDTETSLKQFAPPELNGKAVDDYTDIFKYINPKYIFVRDTKENRIVILHCSYKYDTHQYNVAFLNGKYSGRGGFGKKEIFNEDMLINKK